MRMTLFYATLFVILGAFGAIGLFGEEEIEQPAEANVANTDGGLRWMQVFGIRVIDGDSFAIQWLYMGFGQAMHDQRVRVAGLDCWEMRQGRGGIHYHENETEKGRAAALAAFKLFSAAQAVLVLPPSQGSGKDSFGRLLGNVVLVGEGGKLTEFAPLMKAAGHDRTEHEANARRPQVNRPDPAPETQADKVKRIRRLFTDVTDA